MCDAKKLVQFYSDDIENSLTTAISKDFSMESVVRIFYNWLKNVLISKIL